MPRPSRSNLTRPTAAQSSLSHCRTVRFSMRPHSTGQTSATGRSHMTIPPEWMPRWRGKSSTSAARASTSAGMSWSTWPSGPRWSGRRPRGSSGRSAWPRHPAGRGVAQGLGHVPHRRAGPVGDDVGHLGGIGPAVALVDVLDDLLPPVALDVDVDVRRAVPLRREEALEEQAEPHRVGVGDPEGVADRRVGGAAPPLAEDPRSPGRTPRCPRPPGSTPGTPAARSSPTRDRSAHTPTAPPPLPLPSSFWRPICRSWPGNQAPEGRGSPVGGRSGSGRPAR